MANLIRVNALTNKCAASLVFDNLDFIPLTYDFSSTPCSGQKVANLLVPLGAPTGGVSVQWQCTGETPSCNRAIILEGHGDVDMRVHYDKLFDCVTPVVHTTTSIQTLVRGTNDVTQTQTSTITSLSTIHTGVTSAIRTTESPPITTLQKSTVTGTVTTRTDGDTLMPTTTTKMTTSSPAQTTPSSPRTTSTSAWTKSSSAQPITYTATKTLTGC